MSIITRMRRPPRKRDGRAVMVALTPTPTPASALGQQLSLTTSAVRSGPSAPGAPPRAPASAPPPTSPTMPTAAPTTPGRSFYGRNPRAATRAPLHPADSHTAHHVASVCTLSCDPALQCIPRPLEIMRTTHPLQGPALPGAGSYLEPGPSAASPSNATPRPRPAGV